MSKKKIAKNKEMHQNNKLHFLFICTANVQRSPTAEGLFEGIDEVEARSAGIHPLAAKRVYQPAIDWADKIFVMETGHMSFLEKNLDVSGKEIINLEIPDMYERDDPKLISILKEKLDKFL